MYQIRCIHTTNEKPNMEVEIDESLILIIAWNETYPNLTFDSHFFDI